MIPLPEKSSFHRFHRVAISAEKMLTATDMSYLQPVIHESARW